MSRKDVRAKHKIAVQKKNRVEWRKHLSESLMGNKLSEETKEKLSKIQKGRKLKNQIVVHHKDGNHENDVPENRQKMTRSEHTKLHYSQGDYPNFKGK